MNDTVCAADDCDRRAVAREVCLLHYKRLRRNGHTGLRAPQSIAEYMRERTKPVGRSEVARLDGCHEWMGTLALNGYGQVGLRTHHKLLAHRVAYELARGPIPEGLVIDHLCHNRKCVNPEHLEAVTNEENLRRGDGYSLTNGGRSRCINGHAYTPENTYINPNNPNDMRCRRCARDRKRAA